MGAIWEEVVTQEVVEAERVVTMDEELVVEERVGESGENRADARRRRYFYIYLHYSYIYLSYLLYRTS